MKSVAQILVVVAALLVTCRALADEAMETRPVKVRVAPGESRSISHAHSASRDTGLLAYQVLPEVALSTGGDFAFLGFVFSGIDLRLGMFGLIEVHTPKPEPRNFFTIPSAPYLWRGLLGFSLALCLEEIGQKWLGPRGALEAAFSYRHESEHYTGSTPMFPNVPNIGDFVMGDLALRKALGPVDMEVRFQNKFFFPNQAYSQGPGADLIFRYRALTWLHPLLSVFGEYLLGDTYSFRGQREQIRDNRMLRVLLGIIFPGETADIQILFTFHAGHGKGLLAYEDEVRVGWAVRVGFFKRSLIPDSTT